ncbi:glycosyltransferase family 39 protein [Candidatus Woesearchaeota archaeon]|nr:glycosyltransferase family 39 protein [Candidatus Woesearchaeota archaeon]
MALSLLMLAVFLTVAFASGRKLLALFRADFNFSKAEEFLISVALGAGLLMNATILLGVFKVLYKEAYILIALAVLVLCFREVRRLWQLAMSFAIHLRQVLKPMKPSVAGFLTLSFLFFALINFIPALTPAYEFDSMGYHMAFAKVYAGSHSLVYQPSQFYSTMPQGMTMLYTISELFSAPNLSPLIAYSFGILASLAIYALVRKNHSETAATAGALLFFTMPAVIERLPQTMVDISVAYFFLAAVIVLFKYASETDNRKRILLVLLCGALVGLAASIKLTGFFVAAAFVIGMVLSRLLYGKEVGLKEKSIRTAVEIAVFLAVVLLLATPWLVRSYAYTGNPVYPLAYGVFGGKYLLPSLGTAYETYHSNVGLDKSIASVLLVLWNMTFRSAAFGTVIGITPFLMMLLPLAALFFKDIVDFKKWLVLFAMGAAVIMITFFVHPVLRYMFAGLALLSAAAALTMEPMLRHRLLKAAIVLMLAFSLAFSAAIWYGINAKSVLYIVSGESESQYYGKLTDHNAYGAAAWIASNTQPDAVVLLFNEPRGYFLDRAYVVSSPFQNYIDYWSMNGSEGLLARLEELRISHILINDALPDTYGKAANGTHAIELMRNLTEDAGKSVQVYNKSNVRVYELK